MRAATIAIIMGAQFIAAPGAARERLLTSTDEWRLQEQEEYCSLTRNFVDPSGNGVRLQLQSFGPATTFKVTMVGEGLPLRDRRRGVATFKVRFKPDPNWREVYGTTGFVGEVDALTFSTDLATAHQAEQRQRALEAEDGIDEGWSDIMAARAAEFDQLALAYRSRDDTVLQLGTMAQPIAQLRGCAQGLLGKWGYDPATYGGLRRTPRLMNGLEVADSVVRAMLDAKVGHNDAIHIRMDVDEKGMAARCIVQQPRRGSEIEALICKTVRETAQFEPAIGAGGEPVRGLYVTAIVFRVR
jgi:hypothetical protein